VRLLQHSQARALVTAPIAKHLWHAAGHRYPGQTERLAELAGSDRSSMLFTAVSPYSAWRLKHLVSHHPYPSRNGCSNAHARAGQPQAGRALGLLSTIQPASSPCGLRTQSPCGEAGQLGSEEMTWLTPLIERWRAQHPEIRLDGPLPPDTCWLSAAQAWNQPNQSGPDGFLALYHDQGLIPVKLMAFDAAGEHHLGIALPENVTRSRHGV
jgi:4-hydroxythreonine-4-phosphate dehydrogenase